LLKRILAAQLEKQPRQRRMLQQSHVLQIRGADLCGVAGLVDGVPDPAP